MRRTAQILILILWLSSCSHKESECRVGNAQYTSPIDLKRAMVISILGQLYVFDEGDSSMHRIVDFSPEARASRQRFDVAAADHQWPEYKAAGDLQGYRFSCATYEAGWIAVTTMTLGSPTEYTHADYEATMNSPRARAEAHKRAEARRRSGAKTHDPPPS